MRSGNAHLSTWTGSYQKFRIGAAGGAEHSPDAAATANQRASIPSCVIAQFFGVRRSVMRSTGVYANPRVNVFATRHFLVSNVAQ